MTHSHAVRTWMVTLSLVSGLGAMGVACTALGQDRQGDNQSRDHRAAGHPRADRGDQHGNRNRRDEVRRGNRYRGGRDYVYAPAYEYAPPPVQYDPYPSPGINLFFRF